MHCADFLGKLLFFSQQDNTVFDMEFQTFQGLAL